MITEDGKIEFNEQEQAVIDKAIGDRLSREAIHDKNEIVELLKDFGYEGTPAEIKYAVKQQAEEFKRQQEQAIKEEELETLKKQAEYTGTSPELLAEIKALKADLTEMKGERQAVKEAENQRIANDKMFSDQVDFFSQDEETKDVDLVKLNENPKFIKFLNKQRPTGNPDFLVEVYKDYMELVGGAESEALAKMQSNLSRSTSGGRSKGDSSGTYGLSPEQISTVDDWNKKNPRMKMTYKEFSERK